jgi:hypothetical protein
MSQTKDKKKKPDNTEIREVTLSDNSNDLDLGLFSPATDVSFEVDSSKVRYGSKSTYKSTAELNSEYQRKVKAAEEILADPAAINQFILNTNERRRAQERQAAENRILFEQKRSFDLAEKRTKEREAAKARLLQNENETHRTMRLKAEEERRQERQQILDKISRQKQKQLEACEVFFEQSKNSFITKYENNAVDTLVDSPVAQIISSREFGSNKYGAQKYAYRCSVCKYNNEESLSLGTIHRHIYNHKDKHLQALIVIVEQDYQKKVNAKRFDFQRQDDPELRNAKLDTDISNLKQVKGGSPRTVNAIQKRFNC